MKKNILFFAGIQSLMGKLCLVGGLLIIFSLRTEVQAQTIRVGEELLSISNKQLDSSERITMSSLDAENDGGISSTQSTSSESQYSNNAFGVSISPNPTTEAATVSAGMGVDITEFSVLDGSGNTVYQIDTSTTKEFSINLASGDYTIILDTSVGSMISGTWTVIRN